MITAHASKHLDTPAGQAEARLTLSLFETLNELPHPVEAHPCPRAGRVDVHVADVASLAAWAAAFHTPVLEHGLVVETHAVVNGYLVEVWALAGDTARPLGEQLLIQSERDLVQAPAVRP